ncbi:hypothetical protein JYU34_018932 [Plutella xylostella]|uniref:VWFC domain-containing protein n=1 Tax=Plutella xylostella TaxID=51655 RepID=A0ABQ7PYT8_PLUXY|nr:hypothetical protein JYU34_018932 [Plutella xylostella]
MRAPPAWCAALLLACASAAAYTVDCNHEYTDCENELNKQQTVEDYESSTSQTESATVTTESTPKLPDRTTPKNIPSTTHAPELDPFLESEVEKSTKDPHKLTIDELQTFASLLHNQTTSFPKGKALDLSDISLDSDEEEKVDKDDKKLQEKLFPKMEAPFGNLMATDKSDELDGTCKEMGNVYKIGDKLDRACEESCECAPGGSFDCSPRCKHPYVRRGRRLGDPLCFESPVDDCCSIIACATGNNDGSQKAPIDGCRHGNESYVVGQKWNIGCEQTCSCDAKNVVTCKPRCAPLKTSDKCIAVADPRDACCQLQVCDVSEDAHEEPENVTSSTTSTTEQSQFRPLAPTPLPEDNEYHYEKEEELIRNNDDRQPANDKEADRRTELYTNKPPMAQRPLVLMEPIGSVTVLQNQTVQVNLIHPNNTKDPIHLLLSSDGGKSYKDIELKYSNLILNLDGGKDYVLKTKETGTKFNFTVTASDTGVDTSELQQAKQNDSMTGCLHEGTMYAIGEEYHIGCTELCECVGHNRSECAALACPSHVGLELVSRGCVQWAPGPAPRPPNCCPRAARCLSDGSCKLAGHTHVGLELVSRGCVQWAPGPAPRPPNCCPRAARCLSDGSCKLAGHTHVGLELVSRGCVQWAPGPAPRPPNCCPRAARCLSDGSCKLAGHTQVQ